MIKKIWHNSLREHHPIWYVCLLVAMSFSVIGFIYLFFSGELEFDKSIQLTVVIGYLLVILSLGVMLLGIFVNLVRASLYQRQAIRYSQELLEVQTKNQSLAKQISKEKQ